MNATRKLLTTGIALGLSLAAAPAWAAGASTAWIAVLATGQANHPARAEADDLLRRAAEAIDQGQLELAASMIDRAERTGAQYNAWDQGLTPQNVRGRLEATRAGGAASRTNPYGGPNAAAPANGPNPNGAVANGPSNDAHAQAALMVRQARMALSQGDLDGAEQLARRAADFRVPESEFRQGEDRPGYVLLEIQQARGRAEAFGRSAAPSGANRYAVEQGDFQSDRDASYPRTVQAEEPIPAFAGEAQRDFDAGIAALRTGDKDKALHHFRQAYANRDSLDPPTAQRLQEHLQLLSMRQVDNGGSAPALESIDPQERGLVEQINADVARRQLESRRMMESDPRGALGILQEAHAKISATQLNPGTKNQLLRRLDRSIADAQRYIDEHQFDLDLNARNDAIRREHDRRQQHRIEVDEKLAALTNEFNQLMRERRFAEAELLAKRAAELDPRNEVVQTLVWKAEFVRQFATQQQLEFDKGRGFNDQINSVVASSQGIDDNNNFYQFPDVESWQEMSNRRKSRYGADGRRRRTARELEIEKRLKSPVLAEFSDQPLEQVIRELCKAAGVNVYVDPRGLESVGVASNTSVSIELAQEISLESALNLILDRFDLKYVIKDEVLKVTSGGIAAGEVFQQTYHVADLVIPIPNFVPTARLGLSGALYDAHARLGYTGPGAFGAPPAIAMAGASGATGATIDPAIMAQIQAQGAFSGGGRNAPVTTGGPGGMGGGPQADFDAITELITTTISPQSWVDVGGQGSVKGFEQNLTLVVSQTQDIHDDIVDLLNQLRRLQDLQVTIEVRFITLSDNFFERIGIDFDFDIDDNNSVGSFDLARDRQTIDLDGDAIADIPNDAGQPGNGDSGASVAVGVQGTSAGSTLLPVPLYTTDLDLQFRQGSFGSTVPTVGGFDPASAASFGFAILSDIEAFVFVQAAQGDARNNVMQAPKVTLFNGQQAFISDTAQRPFVTSVIPVVGEFAAAHAPVVVVLSEGTALSIQAVVSDDRRFVRLTVVPFFSKVSDADRTFMFNGSTTTTTNTSSSSVDSDTDGEVDDTSNDTGTTTTVSGTTVQLPTFEFVTVSTTVSVPDGGTVLLGGIKRLTEQRLEEGVPILSKVPYINRLFKNVGIGRETESLMMMVTPRIIIQEEEEEKMSGVSSGP